MAKRLSWWSLAGLLFAMSVVTAFMLAEWLEKRFMPVVTNFTITSQVQVGDKLQISGEFVKVRESCRFQEVSAYAGKSYLSVEFLDSAKKTTGHSRAAGAQTWGPWLITPYHDKIRLVARHRCHFLWDTTTVLIDQ